jgi:hypothetical protein
MNTSRLLGIAAVVSGMAIAPGCERLTRMWNSDLEYAYLADESGRVDRASVSTDTRVIASAERVGVRATEEPGVSELEVEETHFVRGTLEVVYTGRLVFRCRVEQAFCSRLAAEGRSGTRPRDVFRQWPMRIGPHAP